MALSAPRSTAAAAPAAVPEWIWWEAEAARTSNFPANPFDPGTPKAAAALSGGKWIGADHLTQPLYAEYDVAVRKSGAYDFYARKFWRHGPFRWRFDDQPWRRSGPDVALLDDVSLAKFVNANWVSLGAVELAAGRHVLRVEVDAGASAVAFDCFLLIDGPFVPRGKLKPGEKYGVAPDGWFAFEPDADPLAASPLDLRWLNERAAGEGGFIQVKGDVFVQEKTGKPIRFWGVDLEADILKQEGGALERFARRLAKSGVNLVRVHQPLWREDDLKRVDGTKLNSLHRFVAALKREGIYLSLSTYYPLWLQPSGPPGPNGQPGFEGYDGRLNPFGAAFFNPTLQQLQKGWWREALTAKNPYTGVTLLQDPTLAFLEIQNEDSLLFWTFSPYENVPAAQMEILERDFGRWLATKYGSIARAFESWSGPRIHGDAAASGRVGVMSAGELAGKRNPRSRDTALFLADLQRRYYDQMRAYLKQELGFRGSVTGSNWITADGERLGPLDKWSNAGCDFMDRHGYFGGPHQGESATYLLSPGDRYNDASALRFETGKPGESSFNLPLMDLAYDGKPSMISELNWPPPNRFRAELPVLAAAYGALQGTDAIVFFAAESAGWAEHLVKFSVSDPSVLGQFPATALAFRAGLIRTGGVSQQLEAKLSKVFALEGAGLETIDPLTYLTGRVEVDLTDAADGSARGGSSHAIDLSALIDRPHKVVRSSTGELTWDYGRGLVTINAPAVQGATGFFSRVGPIKLGELTFESPLEYGSLLLVAMDGRPLASSRKMLLQVMSEDNNFGWSAPGTGLRPIVDVGGPPIVVKRIEGTLSMSRPDAAALKVAPLDANGYPSLPRRPIQGAKRLTLLPTTLYYLVEK
ncbi:MAG TPA: hypothetical protein VLA79_03760 [Polyangia bacterium]|nr:hypothetical protein [Polyangia bacterium]